MSVFSKFLDNTVGVVARAIQNDFQKGWEIGGHDSLIRDSFVNKAKYQNVDSSDVVGNVALTDVEAKRISAKKNTFKS